MHKLHLAQIYRLRISHESPSLISIVVVVCSFSVPPHQILVYDASGRDVSGAIGPLYEGDNLVLSCEVRGGKSNKAKTTMNNARNLCGPTANHANMRPNHSRGIKARFDRAHLCHHIINFHSYMHGIFIS